MRIRAIAGSAIWLFYIGLFIFALSTQPFKEDATPLQILGGLLLIIFAGVGFFSVCSISINWAITTEKKAKQ